MQELGFQGVVDTGGKQTGRLSYVRNGIEQRAVDAQTRKGRCGLRAGFIATKKIDDQQQTIIDTLSCLGLWPVVIVLFGGPEAFSG
jgi:hypothetical protein